MSDWNKKYPWPDRSNHWLQQNAKREFYPEIDEGRSAFVSADGRPVHVEAWLDLDTQTPLLSVYYSTVEIDAWSVEDHIKYLSALDRVEKGIDLSQGVSASKLNDASGNEIWCVTFVRTASSS